MTIPARVLRSAGLPREERRLVLQRRAYLRLEKEQSVRAPVIPNPMRDEANQENERIDWEWTEAERQRRSAAAEVEEGQRELEEARRARAAREQRRIWLVRIIIFGAAILAIILLLVFLGRPLYKKAGQVVEKQPAEIYGPAKTEVPKVQVPAIKEPPVEATKHLGTPKVETLEFQLQKEKELALQKEKEFQEKEKQVNEEKIGALQARLDKLEAEKKAAEAKARAARVRATAVPAGPKIITPPVTRTEFVSATPPPPVEPATPSGTATVSTPGDFHLRNPGADPFLGPFQTREELRDKFLPNGALFESSYHRAEPNQDAYKERRAMENALNSGIGVRPYTVPKGTRFDWMIMGRNGRVERNVVTEVDLPGLAVDIQPDPNSRIETLFWPFACANAAPLGSRPALVVVQAVVPPPAPYIPQEQPPEKKEGNITININNTANGGNASAVSNGPTAETPRVSYPSPAPSYFVQPGFSASVGAGIVWGPRLYYERPDAYWSSEYNCLLDRYGYGWKLSRYRGRDVFYRSNSIINNRGHGYGRGGHGSFGGGPGGGRGHR